MISKINFEVPSLGVIACVHRDDTEGLVKVYSIPEDELCTKEMMTRTKL